MPVTKIAVIVSVAEARVATLASAHHDSTGICAASRLVIMPRIASFSALARVKDWITATLPSASEAWAASPEWYASTRPWRVSVRRITKVVRPVNTRTSTTRIEPSCQFTRSVIGSSTPSETSAHRWSRKKPSHSQAMPLVPSSIALRIRPE